MRQNALQQAATLAQGATPEAARPLVEALLAADPDDGDALTLLGMIEQRAGHVDAALAALGRARALDPANPARLGNHALALKRAGDFHGAIEALQTALRLRPGAAVTLANLGGCLIDAGRAGEAVAPLEAALAARPEHFDALANLGIARARTGDLAAAIGAYDKALALRPDAIEVRLNRVDALVAGGRADEALRTLEAMLARYPGHPRASNQLAGLLEAKGDLEGAIAVYGEALDRGGLNHPVGVNLTRALVQTGRPREAVALADRLIAALPSVTTPLALKCAALERAGEAEALAALMGLDEFVRVIDVMDVPGFETREAFDAALAEELVAHASLTFEPEGLVTRGGRQSDELATASTPALVALGALARRAIADYLETAPAGGHPFLKARPKSWSLTLWGTILTPGGTVDAHIHAPNWLSGVYYPALPEVVSRGQEGWLAMGALPEALGGGGTQQRYEPRAGRMILFPSYVWHATLPFSGDTPRLSFAFDCVPRGVGRPHRLTR
ncbi:tetratricopeptide repeat protein [Polymorphobacter sp.]|uniref:tetratricopeptide repeat protein n=1 Tax=Polymorphobacter sp. TaxID=1909290 RepID=UPI003F7166D3